ncbi:hypothetical protein L873DRAFT_207827 [Choiromyces venosus 120613-1]|uniref:Uncharacterized protein n=1 Tax=Choiromyces venosus 120613-1 TaxID=1336337 RepID=A0A3N4JEJ2_9PEZI|nr:hypothetical protein L873DRAFT_207827 [Choiromyces venosus 120613-1]
MAHNGRKKQILRLAAEQRKQNRAGTLLEERNTLQTQPPLGNVPSFMPIPMWESNSEEESSSEDDERKEEEEEVVYPVVDSERSKLEEECRREMGLRVVHLTDFDTSIEGQKAVRPSQLG